MVIRKRTELKSSRRGTTASDEAQQSTAEGEVQVPKRGEETEEEELLAGMQTWQAHAQRTRRRMD